MRTGKKDTAASRYKEECKNRTQFVTTGDECSQFTLPRFHSKKGTNTKVRIETPMQSVGAYGVNNIASKLLLTLFPSNTLFFQKKADSSVIKEAEAQDVKSDIEKALQDRDLMMLEFMESAGDRPKLYQLLIRAIITGNVLIYVPQHEKGSIRIFPLSQYVVKRDGSGNLLEIIIQEKLSPLMLNADEVGEEHKAKLVKQYEEDGKDIEVYTHIKYNGETYDTYQEIDGKKIESSVGSYPKDALPWIPLRLTAIDGEHYGRGLVEEYLGDLKSLEVLTKAITGGAAASARILVFVRPDGHTNINDVTDTENGGVLPGHADDVTILQMDKRADYQTAEKLIQTLEERLSSAFLLNSAVQRQAERVTAEEIRYVARELEDGLGGLYSMLSHELQLPYVVAKEFRLIQAEKLEPLPKEVVQPVIITGFDALGRGNDKMKLINYVKAAMETLGPEVVQPRINVGEFLLRLGIADGVETIGLLKTEDQLQAEQQQQQEQQMTPELIKQAGAMAQQAIKQPTQ